MNSTTRPEKQTSFASEKNEKELSGKTPVRILVEIVSANDLSPRKRKSSKRHTRDDSVLDWVKDNDQSSDATNSVTDDISNYYNTKPGIKVNSFCRVDYKQRMIHQTLKIVNDNNPIWTIDARSLFILNTTLEEILLSSNSKLYTQKNLNINFEVRNKKSALIKVPGRSSLDLKNSASIGFVSLSLSDIVEKYCTEERFEFELSEFWGSRDDRINRINSNLIKAGTKCSRGTLALRFRLATGNDVLFVQNINKQIRENENTIQNTLLGKSNLYFIEDNNEYTKTNKVKLITEMDETEVAGNDVIEKMTSAAFSIQESMSTLREQVHSIATSSKHNPSRKLVKPHSDPKSPFETRFLSDHEIENETFLSPSHNWVKAGSGKLGKIYLEVLGCHDLPNMDVGEAIGNVTDPFVAAVYEDVLVQTPVIQDELSPRWLPWTQRAFILHMMHPSSMIYLGVFDFDLGLGTHQPIGRVAVNVGNLKKNMTYTLKYDLFPSSIIAERKKSGSITIRLRIEIKDDRAFLIAGLKPRPKMYVNVRKEKSFNVVRFTCFGEYGEEEQFDLTILRSYINELFEYKTNISYSISDSFTSLMCWRGQVKMGPILLPIHSAIFFFSSTFIIERPHLLPATFFFGLAWIMLANMGSRINHPSPWAKCNTFLHFFTILYRGESPSSGPDSTIHSMEKFRAAAEYDYAWEKRVENDWATSVKQAKLNDKINNEIGDEKIQTKVSSILEIELLSKLGRWQNIVGGICKYLRRIRIIMIWEESFLSFWITMAFLALGIISVIFPMATILQCSGRIIIWTCFGPWMKIVDILRPKSRDENRKREANNIQKRSKIARVKREEALKLQKMKIMKYGDYIVPVPAFNVDRHYDRPLAESTARPDSQKNLSFVDKEINEIGSIPGQQLYGTMIPRAEREMEQNLEESKTLKGHIIDLMKEYKEHHTSTEGDTNDIKNDDITENLSDVMSVESNSNSAITISECDTNKSEGFEVVLNERKPRQDIYSSSLGKSVTIIRTESIEKSVSSHTKVE